jgi:membrane protein YqaA with SNARE-associated domain
LLTAENSTSAASTPVQLSRAKVAVSLLVAILLILAILALLGLFLKEPVIALSRGFVDWLGGFGIALGFFLPDAVPNPLPHDAFLTFGLLGGIPFWEIVAWAGCGSIAGGCIGFMIGRRIKHTKWFLDKVVMKRRETYEWVKQYRAVALILGTMTPLRYGVMAWVCGALEMSFPVFLGLSLFRFLRVASYLWLIEVGVVHFIKS